MPFSIEDVAAEFRAEHPNLPHGIKITIEPLTDSLLVGNDELAFVITRAVIADNLHKPVFEASLKHLVQILSEGIRLVDPHFYVLTKNG